MAEGLLQRRTAQRAGVAQVFLNDVDEAIKDVEWVKENGLRGGILLPNLAPDVKWVKPLYDPSTTGCGRSARTSVFR